MKIKDVMPWNWGKRDVPVHRNGTEGGDGENAVLALQSDMNRVFDDFWRGFGLPMSRDWDVGFANDAIPVVDMRETGKAVEIIAEMPGMTESDVDVRVAEGTLTIRGEKTTESEKEKTGYVLRERSFGRIERVVPLQEGLALDATNATFKNGVLTVTIPKTERAQAEVKRVSVRRA
jgi:HSP20 family protein